MNERKVYPVCFDKNAGMLDQLRTKLRWSWSATNKRKFNGCPDICNSGPVLQKLSISKTIGETTACTISFRQAN